jgi:hypothetical protein
VTPWLRPHLGLRLARITGVPSKEI